MTREEAVLILTRLEEGCDEHAVAVLTNYAKEAFQMAITALQTDGDCISRQAVINEVAEWMLEYGGEDEKRERVALEHVANGIKKLPSVQPEKLTDKEQRIFLSAMGREEDVCKEVDDAWRDCRESYEDSLVHVCKEIRRKVKGALWT